MPAKGLDFFDNIINTTPPCLSVIAKIELLGFAMKVHEEILARQFVSKSIIIDLTDEIVETAISLRKQRKIRRTPDAVILATALIFDLTLLTRNMDDFKNVDGLNLVNPWDIS